MFTLDDAKAVVSGATQTAPDQPPQKVTTNEPQQVEDGPFSLSDAQDVVAHGQQAFSQDNSVLAFARGAARSAGGAVGGALGGAAGVALAPETFGLSLLIPLATAFVGGYAGGQTQEYLTKKFETPEETQKRLETMSYDEQQHEYASKLGELATTLPTFTPNPEELFNTATGIAKIATRQALSDVQKAAVQRTFAQFGVGAANTVATNVITGQPVTLGDVMEGGATFALFSHPTPLGRMLGFGHTPKPQPSGMMEADPAIQQKVDDITAQANRAVPTVATETDKQLSEVFNSINLVNEQLKSATEEQKPVLQQQLDGLNKRAEELSRNVSDVKEEPMLPDGVQTFTTAQGSKYSVDEEGHTTRLKLSDGPGQGELHPASPVVYLDPQDADTIDHTRNSGGNLTLLGDDSEGNVTEIKPDKSTNLSDYSNLRVQATDSGGDHTTVAATLKPEVGLTPFEILHEGDKRYTHFGNTITDVSEPKSLVNETAPKTIEQAISTNRSAGTQIELVDGSRETLNPLGGIDADHGIQTMNGFVDPKVVTKVLSHDGKTLWERPATAKPIAVDKTAQLQEQRAMLDAWQGPDSPESQAFRSQRIKEIDAQLSNPDLHPDSVAPTHKFVEDNLANETSGARVADTRAKIHGEIDSLSEDPTYRGQIKAAVEPHLNFLDGEDIKIKKGNEWAVVPKDKGGIEIHIPDKENLDVANRRRERQGGIPASADTFDKVVAHEVIHAAWYSHLRDQWIEKGSKGSFADYAGKENSRIGRNLRMSYRGMADEVQAIYGKFPKGMEDAHLGAEFLRMVVERARTGQLTEDIRAQSEATRLGGAPATRALRTLIDGARRMKEVIARYLHPDTAPKSIREAYDGINNVLDRYGIIKPNPEPPLTEFRPSEPARKAIEFRKPETPEPPKVTPKVEPDVPKTPEEQQAQIAAHEQKLAELANQKQQVREAPARKTFLDTVRQAKDASGEQEANLVQEAARRHASLQGALDTKAKVADAHDSFKIQTGLKISRADYAKAVEDSRVNRPIPASQYLRDRGDEPNAAIPGVPEEDRNKYPLSRSENMRQMKALNDWAREHGFDSLEQMNEEHPELLAKAMQDFRQSNPRFTHEELARMVRSDFDQLPKEHQQSLVNEAERQMDSVKVQTDGEGNLVAPNGEKSNLNTQQWKMVRTPFFRQWFGDWMHTPETASKVVDKNGEPMVVYHGTQSQRPFQVFDTAASKYFLGSHFGTVDAAASRATTGIFETYLNIKNPVEWPRQEAGFQNPRGILADAMDEGYITKDAYKDFANVIDDMPMAVQGTPKFSAVQRAVMDFLYSKGVDGIKYINGSEDRGSTSWIAFKSEQIKSATGNQGTFSDSPSILKSEGISEDLSQADKEASDHIARQLPPDLLVNERSDLTPSIPKSRMDLTTFSSEELEHYSQPQGPEAIAAAGRIQEFGGVLKTADKLLSNPELEGYGMGGAEKVGVYDLAIRGLDRIRALSDTGKVELPDAEYNDIAAKMRTLDTARANLLLESGRASSFAGRALERLIDGARVVQDYSNAILTEGKRKLGMDLRNPILRDIRDRLNNYKTNLIDRVITRPEYIAATRALQKDLDSGRFDRRAKKSWAKSEAVKNDVRGSALRVAGDTMGNESDPILNESARRIVRMFDDGVTARPQDANSDKMFWSAVSETAREAARETGLIPETAKATKENPVEQLSRVLNNKPLYDEFVDRMIRLAADKFGGDRMSPEQRDQLQNFANQLRSREWSNGLREQVVNDVSKDLGIKFTDLVRETYGKGVDATEAIKSKVAEALKAHGVTDDSAITRATSDIESLVNEKLKKAREKLVGSSGEIRKTLKELGETIGDYAKSGYVRQDQIGNDLARRYTEKLMLPEEHAQALAQVVHDQLNTLGVKEQVRIIKALLNPKEKTTRQIEPAIEKIIQFSSMGVLKEEDIYNAIAQKHRLPEFNPEIAAKLQEWGERIGNMPQDTQDRTGEIIKLGRFIESQKGVNWKDMAVAGMYSSILSGPSTHAVNAVSNAFNLAGEVYTAITKDIASNGGRNSGAIMRSLFYGLNSGRIEFARTIKTGLALGKLNQKYEFNNPLEHEDRVYSDRGAKVLGTVLDASKAKYVVRALQAADMLFYKINREVSFAAKTGKVGTADEWNSAKTIARDQLGATAPDNQVEARATEIYEKQRLVNENGKVDQNLSDAWVEAHSDALNATFNNDPKGAIGFLSNLIGKFTQEYPASKLLVPFTRVVANVINTQLDWTPVGIARFLHTEYGGGKTWVDAKGGADVAHLIRGVTGTVAMGALFGLAGKYMDDDNPFFAVYGSGPTDANAKRQLLEQGWKPNTIKIGGSYFNYLPTPFALAFSALGAVMDKQREKGNIDPARFGIALVQGITQQSFLSSIANLFSAIDSPDPEARMRNLMSQAITIPVPALAKQFDQWLDPSVQTSDSLYGNIIKTIPVVRHMEKGMLNVFGQEVNRTEGPYNMPFLNRFVTQQKMDDPVWQLIANKRLTVPGYSKTSKLGNEIMTTDQLYQYVQQAGPEVKSRIYRDIDKLTAMTREKAQDRVNEISQDVKEAVRSRMRRAMR